MEYEVNGIRGRVKATHLDYPVSRAVHDVEAMLQAYDNLQTEVEQLRQQLAEARTALEKSEREREKWHLDYLGLGQVTDDTYNDIWEIVGDGKGEWDYPAQITRYVGYMRDELVKARQALAGEQGDA